MHGRVSPTSVVTHSLQVSWLVNSMHMPVQHLKCTAVKHQQRFVPQAYKVLENALTIAELL